MAGKRVFICAAPQDSAYYVDIVAALDAWQATHTEIGIAPEPAFALPPQIERAIGNCEVFLRLCTANTKRSSAVNLATQYFLQLLAADRRRGNNQRRKLVNLILDPAYPLDDDERKTLYIITQGKSRALWLEELAVPVGVATLQQRISRRALLGMGIGATLTLASAGTAGVLLYQQKQEPPLLNRAKISGNPKHIFRLSNTPADSFATVPYARLFQDGSTIYAQPVLGVADADRRPDNSVYVLSVSDAKQRKVPIATDPSFYQHQLVAASQGLLFLYFDDSNDIETPLANPSLLQAMNAKDGTLRWSFKCYLASTPVLANDTVYCAMTIGTSRTTETETAQLSLNALHARDGSTLWSVPTDNQDSDLVPIVANGSVYFGSADHHIYSLDAATGKERWKYLTRGPVFGTPRLSNGLIYIGSEDTYLYALDAATGALRWRFAASDGVAVTPLIDAGVVYVASRDNYIYALDGRSGALFWRTYVGVDQHTDDIAIREMEGDALASYRNILFATSYGGLYAFDILNGSRRWRYIPLEEDQNAVSPPIISNGLALVGAADNQVYAVNP